MGMYDTIYADCPLCKERNGLGFQTKTGECTLASYTLENAPLEVLQDRYRLFERGTICQKCNKRFKLNVEIGIIKKEIICDEW